MPHGDRTCYVLPMITSTSADLREQREAIVRQHADAETRYAVDATLATFHRARYEVAPLGVSDGETAVRDLLNGMITGFPDWHIETGPFRHGADFVFVEVRMTGTDNGPICRMGTNRPKDGRQSGVRLRIRRRSLGVREGLFRHGDCDAPTREIVDRG